MAVLFPGIGKRIESPISSFNNLLMQITKKIELIYFPERKHDKDKDVKFINQLLFTEKSITIFGYIQLVYANNDIGVKFCGVLDDMRYVQITIDKQKELYLIFQNYLYIIQTTSTNLDSTITHKHVESLFEQIISGTVNPEQYFILPYKEKIKHLYDYDKEDKTLEKVFNRFSYVVKFNVENKQTFQYKLCRVLSSSLNESNSLDNVRFEDIELLKKDIINVSKLQNFLVELFYYGNIN